MKVPGNEGASLPATEPAMQKAATCCTGKLMLGEKWPRERPTERLDGRGVFPESTKQHWGDSQNAKIGAALKFAKRTDSPFRVSIQ